MRIGQLLTGLFSALNQRGVTYCIVRNYEGLPYDPGNDVDMWVKEADQRKFEAVLLDTAERLDWRLIRPNVSPRLSRQVEGKYYIVTARPFPCIVHLDCWTFFHWRGVKFIDDRVLSKYVHRHEKGFYVPSAGIEAGISLLTDLLYRKTVLIRRRGKLARYLSRDSSSFVAVTKGPIGLRAAESIAQAAREQRWDVLENRASQLRLALVWRSLLSKPVSQLASWCIYTYRAIRILFFAQYGVFLVLIGPDGSGKTTVAQELLKSAFIGKLVERRHYFHTQFPFLPPLRQLAWRLGLIASVKLENPKDVPRRTEPLPLLRSVLYPIYYGLNNFFGHIWLRKQKSRGGSIVIFDRYFYEYFIQKQFSRCPRWLLHIVLLFVPKPDLLVYLRNAPEVIYKRKAELSIEEIARQARECERIVGSAHESVVVDTSGNIQGIMDALESRILRKVAEASSA